ncbi:unnamed protein product [Rotaria sp. Silwood2]|nr:unnamed protein product [Rotaria sp. Silwood2]CAF3048719.1 unnamed protein product [Rotaria sp. Silwood2]CAF3514928.1 unnamed protein product [Rotaria sp. Silwood2]CAF3979113.1 unnamed protein product [Rotaria sp. Silwood2]CAF4425873.1 unnamed protein product [Rotaria sp. Silwood2]
MFNIDLNEHNPRILGQFYFEQPFIGISVSSITKVVPDGFLIKDKSKQRWISFPTTTHRMGDNEANWLHNRMMSISEQYKNYYDQEQRIAREQASIQAQKELEAHRLDALIHEEELWQQRNFGNDLERMWEGTTSASPRYIAKFRVALHHQVNSDQTELLASSCSVCLDMLQIGEIYDRWPCPGRHVFHEKCILDTLRRKNTCPLCRHPVEPAAPFLSRDIVMRLILQRLFTRFTI